MRQLIYTMHFRGQASPSAEHPKVLRTASSGTSCTLETVVNSAGVETTLHPAAGDLAFLESEVRLAGGDAFEGQGVLTFGDEGEHELRFATVHPGHLGPTGVSGLMAGSVSWHVKGGTGRFESATGLITSTFTLSDSGDVSEYQCGLIFLAD
ncbi:MAG TPA: hypothetical protein VER03_06130 [Bryobacteraceae bacterium]|nr:hypothetical protein [Bryobacteraceae bacterium]